MTLSCLFLYNMETKDKIKKKQLGRILIASTTSGATNLYL